MNGESDGSEYVDDDSERQSNGRSIERQAAKTASKRSKKAKVKREATLEPHVPSRHRGHSDPMIEINIKADTLRAYRDFLNTRITETLQPAEDDPYGTLSPSQIGASFWTAQEKSQLFTAIQSHGSGDLPTLATAIGTKSGPEIQAYIHLLQEGVRELDASATQPFGSMDVPAGIETHLDCLEAEENLAEALEGRARAAEEAKEQQRWGKDLWLINEDAAAAIDERFDSLHEQTSQDGDGKEGQAETDPTASDYEQSGSRPCLSDQLLKASTMLQLSRSLFMNSKDPDMNWHTVSQDQESEIGPSIRRTAFDDFRNLVVSLTRRLMQASLFQAMSRLRASTDSRLLPHVNGFDVAAAEETIGLKTRRPSYWADAVKRCGVEVYSDSKKWRAQQDRHGTKIGFQLTEQELQAELGLGVPEDATHLDEASDIAVGDADAASSDSDAYTIASSSEISDGELTDAEVKVDARGRPSRDRRRPLSPASFCRAETKYLENTDRYNHDDDNEYRQMLGLPVAAPKRKRKPQISYKLAEAAPEPMVWRTVTQYEAPWEQPLGMPRQEDFDAMGMEGARGRKRRRLRDGKSDTLLVDHENLLDADVEAEDGVASSGESDNSSSEADSKSGAAFESDDE